MTDITPFTSQVQSNLILMIISGLTCIVEGQNEPGRVHKKGTIERSETLVFEPWELMEEGKEE